MGVKELCEHLIESDDVVFFVQFITTWKHAKNAYGGFNLAKLCVYLDRYNCFVALAKFEHHLIWPTYWFPRLFVFGRIKFIQYALLNLWKLNICSESELARHYLKCKKATSIAFETCLLLFNSFKASTTNAYKASLTLLCIKRFHSKQMPFFNMDIVRLIAKLVLDSGILDWQDWSNWQMSDLSKPLTRAKKRKLNQKRG